jgi:hypothetical protein
MASTLLNRLGITTPTPDPNLYTNQKEVTSQTEEVQAKIKETSNQVKSLVDVSKLFGVKDDQLKPILALQAKADKLANSDLSPDQLEKERLALEKELGATDPRSIQMNSILQTLQVVKEEIEERVKEVKEDKSLPTAIVAKFEALLSKAVENEADYKRKMAEPAPTPPAGATGAKVIPPAPAALHTPDSLRTELASLETELEKSNRKFSFLRLYRVIVFWISVGLSIVFALIQGLLTMNWYRSNFWTLRLYYFVFGGILFPIFQLLFCFKPPYILTYHPFQEPPGLDEAELKVQHSGTQSAARGISILTTVLSFLLVLFNFGADVIYSWTGS